MNKLELVDYVSGKADVSRQDAGRTVDAVLEGITEALKKGEEVRIVGFGTFGVKNRPAGTGRNPATGAEIQIAASNNAKFKPGASLKGALNPAVAPKPAPAPAAKAAPKGRAKAK